MMVPDGLMPENINDAFGEPLRREYSEPHPAVDRPHPHVIPPTAVEHQWWDRLNEHVDIDRVIAVAMAYHRARCPWEEPGFMENRRELVRLRGMLLAELDDHPNDPMLAYELSRLRGALRRYW